MAAAGYVVACARWQGREEWLVFEGLDGQCDVGKYGWRLCPVIYAKVCCFGIKCTKLIKIVFFRIIFQ